MLRRRWILGIILAFLFSYGVILFVVVYGGPARSSSRTDSCLKAMTRTDKGHNLELNGGRYKFLGNITFKDSLLNEDDFSALYNFGYIRLKINSGNDYKVLNDTGVEVGRMYFIKDKYYLLTCNFLSKDQASINLSYDMNTGIFSGLYRGDYKGVPVKILVSISRVD